MLLSKGETPKKLDAFKEENLLVANSFENQTLKQKVAELETELSTLRHQNSTKDEQIQTLTDKNTAYQQRISVLEETDYSELQRLNLNENKDLKSEINKAQEEISSLGQIITSLKEKHLEALSKLEYQKNLSQKEMNERNYQLVQENVEFENTVAMLKRQNSEQQKKNRRLSQDNLTKKSEINDLKDLIALGEIRVSGADAKSKKLDGIYGITGLVQSDKPVWYCPKRKTCIHFYRRWFISKSSNLRDLINTIEGDYAYSTHENSESEHSPINLVYKTQMKDKAEISNFFSVEKN